MAADKNRFAPELNENEVIKLIIRKRNIREHKASHKVWHENISRLKLDNLSIQVSLSKTMQVETIYTFENYLYIVTSGFFSQNKVEKICLIPWGRF